MTARMNARKTANGVLGQESLVLNQGSILRSGERCGQRGWVLQLLLEVTAK